MKSQMVTIISGSILEEEPTLTLAELCISCQLPAETMIKYVNHGIITPSQEEGQKAGKKVSSEASIKRWHFQRNDLVRADKALRLQQDLGINIAGAALVLELMDELTELRSKQGSLLGTQLRNP